MQRFVRLGLIMILCATYLSLVMSHVINARHVMFHVRKDLVLLIRECRSDTITKIDLNAGFETTFSRPNQFRNLTSLSKRAEGPFELSRFRQFEGHQDEHFEVVFGWHGAMHLLSAAWLYLEKPENAPWPIFTNYFRPR